MLLQFSLKKIELESKTVLTNVFLQSLQIFSYNSWAFTILIKVLFPLDKLTFTPISSKKLGYRMSQQNI